jgi:hypothetical protein
LRKSSGNFPPSSASAAQPGGGAVAPSLLTMVQKTGAIK